VGEVLLILESVSLRQHAAKGMPHQADLSQVQRLADALHILNHVFDGVLGGVFEFF
jgi:hypothetical protein